MSSSHSRDSATAEELERFRNVRWLRNHWARPIGPRAYYWYLTFEDSRELRSLVSDFQERIVFPYYDLTPLHDLHLTLDRIAFEDDITPDQLSAIKGAAIRDCQGIPPFDITVGPLGGTRGAIGITVSPVQPIENLRDALRAATMSAYPDAPIKQSGFHPHVTIAYANSDGVPAAEVIATVEKLNSTACIDATATIDKVVLVLLERRQRSYVWQAISQTPLTG